MRRLANLREASIKDARAISSDYLVLEASGPRGRTGIGCDGVHFLGINKRHRSYANMKSEREEPPAGLWPLAFGNKVERSS